MTLMVLSQMFDLPVAIITPNYIWATHNIDVVTILIVLHDPSSFYLIVCLFYQMDSGQHYNIYVRVHSSTGLSCMYLWCR